MSILVERLPTVMELRTEVERLKAEIERLKAEIGRLNFYKREADQGPP